MQIGGFIDDKMFFELMLAIILGCIAGTVTGLIPGVHVNLISLFLVSVSSYLLGFTNPVVLAVFIISMAVVHTFLDPIPSIFLGAPDADMALGVLPGHRLLLEGKGFEAVKLTVIGSLICLILTIMIIPLMLPLVPLIYEALKPYIGYILIFVVLYMVLLEKGIEKKFYGVFVFVFSGVLGLIVLNWPNFRQPLFPLLSGLFGVSTLVLSLFQNSKIPEQTVSETINVSSMEKTKAILAGVFSGSLTAIFPGLGAAQASIIGMNLVGKISNYGFMILIGGINTVNFAFSLVSYYTLQKARNGAVVAILKILESVNIYGLTVFLCAALIAGSVGTYLALKISKFFAKFIVKVKYRLLCCSIILLIVIMSVVFSGFFGLIVLLVSTALGMVPALIGVKRSNAMGCLMLPVILFFIV